MLIFYCYDKCHYAECSIFVVTLSVIMLNVIMLNVLILSVVAPIYITMNVKKSCKNISIF
jgi:hypothetical protein